MSGKALSFGELMLRLSPPGYQRFLQSPQFEATFGGGEANVAVSLARLGIPAGFISRFPANPIGDAAEGELRRHGVDVSTIIRGGERMGIYYCEKGASQRPSKVVYDRAHSSIATAAHDDFDWKAILAGATWFHFTGITPALSDTCAALCLDACRTARSLKIPVSCDLNYRKNLWTTEKAGTVMRTLMPFVDVLIANEEDCAKVFGIHAEGTRVESGVISREGYQGVAARVTKEFGIPRVAITLRESHSASHNGWAGMWHCPEGDFFSRTWDIQIVDRVGGGDSFGAGLIYSQLTKASPQETIDFAVAASCLKHSVEGDFNLVDLSEIKTLMKGDGSGRVQR